MVKNSVFIAFLLLYSSCIHYSCASLPEDITNTSLDCLTNSLESSSIYCRGSRAMHNIINNLSKADKPIVIVRGLEIVPSRHINTTTTTNNADNNNNNNDGVGRDNDDTFLGGFSRYLRTHELNVKFSDLMTDESERDLARDLEQSGMQINASAEARKKDKGQGMMMVMAVMMSKMMAVLGIGGIGALAMKALGVAMAALMMAAMVGVKSLVHQGAEPSHSVQYVTADGHHHKRRRRSNKVTASTTTLFQPDDINTALPPLAYRAWNK